MYICYVNNSINTMITSSTILSEDATKKGIMNHIIAAKHHELAARYNIEVAKDYQTGNSKKAAHNIIAAQEHLILAELAQKKDLIMHTEET